MYAISLEIIKGNRKDPNNPFKWDYVELNLPSSENYDPSQPWVSKRMKDGNLPSDCFVFVDDGRVPGRTQKTCNQSTRRVASVMNHLGEQDASRKRRGASQHSGAWVGALFRSDNDTIGLATPQDKWDKGKSLVSKWIPIVETQSEVNRKELERDRGFLVHISMIYPSLTLYVKSFHLTLESWRPDRDNEGWKLPVNDWLRLKQHMHDKGDFSFDIPLDYTNAPEMVKVVPRLKNDLLALKTLMEDENPPLRTV